ncbi:YbaN family protein [Microvirga sp. VF16]|uniref:YbaN family protein n=1 Tax=Microvirga sp. VF16 TaxID=2807101 RepID=UPI001FEDBE56|nr:YbaN family protein [Microvirga sp. VF16]
MMRRLYLCLGYASLVLGIVGIFLPVLPTTPFVLVSAWCFARSNPVLAERLYNHPRFGPLLTAWRDQRAIPLHAKFYALAALVLSYALILWLTENRILLVILAAIMGSVGLYIATRPRPRDSSNG